MPPRSNDDQPLAIPQVSQQIKMILRSTTSVDLSTKCILKRLDLFLGEGALLVSSPWVVSHSESLPQFLAHAGHTSILVRPRAVSTSTRSLASNCAPKACLVLPKCPACPHWQRVLVGAEAAVCVIFASHAGRRSGQRQAAVGGSWRGGRS